ncbi:MAG TPA: hypothetical protein VIL42_04130 [Sphingomicrobium sp.]|jgi:type VI protein secretion system component VasF
MAENRHGQGLHNGQEPRSKSSAVKLFAYAAIAVLVVGIILLATGAIKFGPY